MDCNKDKKVHQLNKLCDETLERNNIFPVTVTDAVFDKKTGNSLKSMLLQNNNIFLPFKGSAAATRITLPFDLRRKGIIISYINMDDKAITEKLINADDISDAYIALDANWEEITIESVVNYPDEEDITAIDDKLKFKDKQYVTDSYLGLGRKYLRLNIVDGKNVLTQDMINKENTIYNIQYDYDLNGKSINLPSNCILEFTGGSLNNGTIIGNNSKIKGDLIQIFKINTIINGSWDIIESYPEWFGEKTSTSIQLCLDYFPVVKLTNSEYICNTALVISDSAKILKGEGNNTILDFSTCNAEVCINMSAFRTVLKDLIVKTNNFVENQTGISFIYSTENGQIENVIVQGFYNGININKTWYSVLNNIRIRNISPQGYGMIIGSLTDSSKEEVNNISFNNIWIEGGINSVVFNNVTLGAVVFDTCTFESTQETALKTLSQVNGAISFKNCYFEKNYLNSNRTTESVTLWYKGTNDIQAYFDGGLYRDQSSIKSYIVDNASFISPMYVANTMNFAVDRVIDYTPNGINATKFNKRRYYNENFLQTSFNSLDEQIISLRAIYSSFEVSNGDKKKFATIVLAQDIYYAAYIKVDLIVRAKRPTATIQGVVSYIVYIDKYSSTAADQGMLITQADDFIQKKFSNSELDLRESILLKGKVLPFDASLNTSPFLLYIDVVDGTDYIINAKVQGYRTEAGDNTNNFIIKEDALLTSSELTATDAKIYNKVGITTNRPLEIEKGFLYYDTTLNKYICWNGSAWTNLDGTTL